MKTAKRKNRLKDKKAYALVLALAAALVLTLLGAGLLYICFGVRVRAAKLKRETISMLAAEAGYERAIFWMSQQADILSGLADDTSDAFGTIDFGNSHCEYEIQFHDFIGARPVFRILSKGYSGALNRVVDVFVVQKITGWDMGMCRIPSGSSSTNPVYFAGDEIINIPVHINDRHVEPERDIYITGDPQFKQKVEMGESRYAGSLDKYSGMMGLFDVGIIFDQPDVRITDEDAVQSKVNRFRDSTNSVFRFDNERRPIGTADVPNPYSAVQLEFFVDSGGGQVRITNNCTVRGYPNGTRDYRIVPGSDPMRFEKYDTYAYHYKSDDEMSVTYSMDDETDEIYVTQNFGEKESDPGGQIFVDGNVVIGGDMTIQNGCQVVQGKLTIVATGNIWIADSIFVYGDHTDGIPDKDTNPNVLGLIAQGVIKVIDPGLADYGSPSMNVSGGSTTHTYVPVANAYSSSPTNRILPDPMIIEAAVTVGGGGWGAENVGNRRENPPGPGQQDHLVLIGTISESVRGVVGLVGSDGYIKRYTIDERLLEGVLPGNIWFGGKYVPAPAGWHDYRLTD
jgi:hypothetical protein